METRYKEVISKYVATEKNQILKEGTIIRKNGSRIVIDSKDCGRVELEISDFVEWIQNKWVVKYDEHYIPRKIALSEIHESVIKTINEQFNIIYHSNKIPEAVYARKLFCYFAKNSGIYPSRKIAEYIGKYDYSTVVYNHKWISQRIGSKNHQGINYDVIQIKKYLNLIA